MYEWVDQMDNIVIDLKGDCRLKLLLTNTSGFDWKPGMTLVLLIGKDKEEFSLPSEVKVNSDVDCWFDMKKYVGRDLKSEKTLIKFNWKDPQELTKYFSDKTILNIEFA